MPSSKLTFDILGKDVSGTKALTTFGKKAETTSTGIKSHFKSVAGSVAGAFAGLAAGAAVVKFGKDSVAAFADAEKSQRTLTDAYSRFPAMADVTKKSLQDQATALQLKTKFDGDDINASQGQLAAYKLSGSQIQKLTPLMLDYAEKTGKTLPQAAAIFGKAALGSGAALKKIGINFKDTGSTAGNFKELMGGMNKQVGGFAEKEGKSAAGQAAILSHQFGDVQETVGSYLLPVLTKLSTFLITKVVPVIARLVGFLQSTVKFVRQNATVFKALAVIVGLVAAATAAHTLVLGINSGAMKAALLQSKLIQVATKAWAAVQWVLNAALSANPIALVVIALIALAAGLYLAWKHSEKFREIVKAVFAAVKRAVTTALSAVTTAIRAVFGWVTKNWPLLLGILTGPFGLAAVLIAKNWDKIKTGVIAVKDKVVAVLGDVVSFMSGLPARFTRAVANLFKGLRDAAYLAKDYAGTKMNELVTFLYGLPARFTSAVGNLFKGLRDAAYLARDYAKTKMDELVAYVTGVPGKLTALGQSFLTAGKSLIGSLLSGLKNVGTGVSDIAKSIANSLIDYLNGILPHNISINKGPIHLSVPLFPNIPHLAAGTNYAAGGLSLVGERGPEILNIPRGAQVIPNHKIGMGGSGTALGGGTVINVYVTGSVTTERQLTEAIMTGIATKQRRRGPVTIYGGA